MRSFASVLKKLLFFNIKVGFPFILIMRLIHVHYKSAAYINFLGLSMVTFTADIKKCLAI